jgi:hypothetical protein
MELSYLMLTGSLSGLTSILAHSVVWSGVELARGATKAEARGLATVAVSDAVLHMLCGIGLGLFFWLSWGLAALVAVPWWVRGLSFAALCWVVLTMPMLLELTFAQRLSARLAALTASRWGTTCVIAGLACAWSWENRGF